MSNRAARALLLALVAVVYLPVAGLGYASDDLGLVLENPHTARLANVPSFFVRGLWSGIATSDAAYFRPVMLASLAVDRALWGLSPALHHLHSLGWHLAAVLGVVALLERRVGAERALLAGLIFGLHPVQSEVVAWVSARNDALAVALGAGGALLLDGAALGGVALVGAPGTVALVGGGLLVFLALCAKETAVVAALAWIVLDRAGPRGDRVRRAAAVGAAIVAFLGLRYAAVGGAVPPDDGGWALLGDKALAVAAHYVRLVGAPWPLSDAVTLVYLPADPLGSAAVLVVAAAVAVVLVRRGGAPAAAALLFAALVFAPALPAIASKKLLGDRYLYFPLVGVAAAVAAAVPVGRATRVVAALLAVPAIALVGLRLPAWEDSLSLAEASAAATPSPYADGWLAIELLRHGRYAEARPALARALTATPPYCQAAPIAVQAANGAPTEAVAIGRLVYEHGCAGVPGFREAWAVAHVAAGDRATADQIMTPRPPCDATATPERIALALALDGRDAGGACAAELPDPEGALTKAQALLR